MRDYEGPVFKDNKQNTDKRHFAHRSSRIDSDRKRFEPAYQLPQKPKKAIRSNVDDQQAEVNKAKGMHEGAVSTTSTSGLEHYEIPFLKKEQSNKTIDNANLPRPEDGFMAYNSKAQEDDEDERFKEPVGRTTYTPSYQLKKQQVDQEKVPFKATELPKPYKKVEKKEISLDEDTRELTKRLHKTKESFLLFENGEAINSNDEQK